MSFIYLPILIFEAFLTALEEGENAYDARRAKRKAAKPTVIILQ